MILSLRLRRNINTYYKLRLRYTLLIILILIYILLFDLSLLLYSISLSETQFPLFGMGRLQVTHYINENGVTIWKINTFDPRMLRLLFCCHDKEKQIEMDPLVNFITSLKEHHITPDNKDIHNR